MLWLLITLTVYKDQKVIEKMRIHEKIACTQREVAPNHMITPCASLWYLSHSQYLWTGFSGNLLHKSTEILPYENIDEKIPQVNIRMDVSERG